MFSESQITWQSLVVVGVALWIVYDRLIKPRMVSRRTSEVDRKLEEIQRVLGEYGAKIKELSEDDALSASLRDKRYNEIVDMIKEMKHENKDQHDALRRSILNDSARLHEEMSKQVTRINQVRDSVFVTSANVQEIRTVLRMKGVDMPDSVENRALGALIANEGGD